MNRFNNKKPFNLNQKIKKKFKNQKLEKKYLDIAIKSNYSFIIIVNIFYKSYYLINKKFYSFSYQ